MDIPEDSSSSTRSRQSKSSSKPRFTRYYRADNQVSARSGRPSNSNFSRRRQLIAKFLLIVMVLIFAFVALLAFDYNLAKTPNLEAYGRQNDYQKALEESTSGLIFLLKPLVPQNRLSDSLRSSFSEIRQVTINKKWFSPKVEVEIDVKPPAFVASTSGGRFILDEAGFLAGSPDLLPESTKLNLPQLEDQSGFSATSGQLLSQADVSSLQQVHSHLSKNGVAVNKIVLPPLPSEARVITPDHYIKFNLRGDVNLQLGAYLALRQSISSGKISPASEYIDVRVENKAFIK